MSGSLIVPRWAIERMRSHVAAAAPEEACGLVSGRASLVRRVTPIENMLHSKTRYRMEPYAMVEELMEIDELMEELLAIYHSHPHGPNHPSETDLAEAYYPDAVSIIWYQENENWICKGYAMHPPDTWTQVQLKIGA